MKNSTENPLITDTTELLIGLKKTAEFNTWTKRQKPKNEKGGGRRIVIPDMALSVRTILERYSRGQSLPQNREPIFTDEDYSEIERMDPFEKLDLAQNLRNSISEFQNTPPVQTEKPQASAASEPMASEASEQVKPV